MLALILLDARVCVCWASLGQKLTLKSKFKNVSRLTAKPKVRKSHAKSWNLKDSKEYKLSKLWPRFPMMNTECRYFVSRLSKGLFNQHFLFVVLLSSLQFNPPKNRLNTVFFKGKPTLRLVSDICTIKRSKRKSLRHVYTTEKLCPDQWKKVARYRYLK